MKNSLPVHPAQNSNPQQNRLLPDSLTAVVFDRITQIATLLCDVPVALISLYDGKRQWFTSATGLELPDMASDPAFCQYTIQGTTLFEVENAAKDERFKDDDWVTGYPNICFYAGQPLTDPDGSILGSICVIDRKPNRLTGKQKQALQLLADEVIALIIDRRQKDEINYFEKLFQYSTDLVCIAGTDGFFRKVNPACKTLLGWDEKTLLQTSLLELVHPDDQESTKTEMGKLASGRVNIHFNNRFKTKENGYTTLQWTATPQPGTGKFFAIARDITEELYKEAQLKTSTDRLWSFFKNSQCLMYTHDMHGKFISVNPAGAAMFGYTVEEMSGMSLFDLVPIKYHDSLKDYLEEVNFNGKSNGIMNSVHRNGSPRIWMYNNVIEKDVNGKDYVIGSSIDITERYFLEKDLQRTKQMLEQTNRIARVGGWEYDVIKQKMSWSDITKEIREVTLNYEPELQDALSFYKEGNSRDTIAEAIHLGIEQGKPWDLEEEIITAKGKDIWVRVIGNIEMENGKCKRLFGAFQDIDRQKRTELALEVSENKYRAFFENSPVAISINRYNDGKFITGNKALFDLTGYTEEEYRQLSHADVTPVQYDADEIFHQNALTNLGMYGPYEKEFIHKNGHTVPVLLNGIKFMGSDNEESVYSTIQDITEICLQREEMKKTKELAEKASQAKSEFLANMSHEIRTPLNGVIGFTNLALKTVLNETQRQYITIVAQSAGGLMSLINDILDFSKIEAGEFKLDIEKSELYEIGSQAADMISYQAQTKGLEMLLNIPGNLPRFIWADSLRLKQVLINLLGNAVKFTENGEIELKVEMLQHAGGSQIKFRFSVRDTGIGIHPEKFTKIFEAFSQEDGSTTKKYGGSGLGLTISNKLLGLMGSRLQLKSTQSKGSTFYFDLLLKTEQEKQETWANPGHIKKILVVDDNDSNQAILRQMLALKKIHLTEAKNGLEALQLLTNGEKYDVILMDHHMPYLDGLETAKKIRNGLYTSQKELPIVMLYSSSEDEEVLKACDELAITNRLVKPVKMQDLYQILSHLHKQELQIDQNENKPPVQDNQEFWNVLIVEDNQINMLLTKIIVKKIVPNAIIVEAKNGTEGWKYCETILPDIILIDVQMPEMNGYEATRNIRKIATHKKVPIIALTAGNMKGDRERCIEAGMDDFITKPLVEEDIKLVFDKWIKRSRNEAVSKDPLYTEKNALASINLEKMNASIGDDPDTLFTIKGLLKKELSDGLAKLKKHIAGTDLKAIKEWGHKLYGSAAVTGMDKLADISKRAESLTSLSEKQAKQLAAEAEAEIMLVLQILNQS